MKERRQSNAEYERLSIQKIISKKTNRLLCGTIYYWRDSIYQCSQTKTTNYNENLSSSEHESSSKVQKIS